jgi:hypothetical protein
VQGEAGDDSEIVTRADQQAKQKSCREALFFGRYWGKSGHLVSYCRNVICSVDPDHCILPRRGDPLGAQKIFDLFSATLGEKPRHIRALEW